MSIEMTFNKYMDNPSSGTSTFTNRSMYREMYKNKFDILLVKEQGRILYKIYKTGNGTDSYFIHFKIPSEKTPNLYYDVVIELWTKKNELKSSASLRMYNVRFYSNDQAFIFAFAYAFNKNGLFIKELKDKMNKTALTVVAEQRNPKSEIWYVKSLCFAFFAMEKYGLFSRPMLNQHALKYNHSEFLKAIMHSDDKIEEYKKIQLEIRANAIKEKREKQRQQNMLSKQKFLVKTAHEVSKSKSSKYVSKAKTTSKVKRK